MTGRSVKETIAPAAAGPLAGIKIIDLTSVMMGPYATMILGDYGADVIKVESPEGDVMRYAAPMRHPQMGAMYLQGNRKALDRTRSQEDRRPRCVVAAFGDLRCARS